MSNGRLHHLLDFSAKTNPRFVLPEVDPRRFNDPVALETSWEQQDYSNKTFTTHVLEKVGEHQLVFRPTFAIKLLGAAFFVIGAVLAISFSTRVIDSLTALVSGSAFLLAALYIALRNLKPEGFDNNRRIFHRGYSIQKDTRRLRGGKTLPFAEIHAVQLLTKAGAMKVGSDIYMADEYFPAYELNLVTQEADRVFLMTYLDKATALQDAQIISDFTGVPLWSVLPQ